MSVHLNLESADQPDVIALIDALDAYQKPLYPPESHHGIDIAALTAPSVLFAVARDEHGRALACGALVLEHDYAELKRMVTTPPARGQGIARQLLRFLERAAVQRGVKRFVLETGVLQHEALRLYAREGYVRCAPFGDYVEDPHSVFMEKTVSG